MSHHARRRREGDAPVTAMLPTIEQCVFHRCPDHDDVPQLDDGANGAECGACIAEQMLAVRAQLLLALDGFADRLVYGAALARKLDSARARLNLLSPGAGDSLDDDTPVDWRSEVSRRSTRE